MAKVRAYLSHPVRGKSGNNATSREIEYNRQKGIVTSKILSICVPNLDIYCPGEHDEFPEAALYDHYLTLEDVLNIDCKILHKRDLLIVYDWQNFWSAGMMKEIVYATMHHLEQYFFSSFCPKVVVELSVVVDKILSEGNIK